MKTDSRSRISKSISQLHMGHSQRPLWSLVTLLSTAQCVTKANRLTLLSTAQCVTKANRLTLLSTAQCVTKANRLTLLSTAQCVTKANRLTMSENLQHTWVTTMLQYAPALRSMNESSIYCGTYDTQQAMNDMSIAINEWVQYILRHLRRTTINERYEHCDQWMSPVYTAAPTTHNNKWTIWALRSMNESSIYCGTYDTQQ